MRGSEQNLEFSKWLIKVSLLVALLIAGIVVIAFVFRDDSKITLGASALLTLLVKRLFDLFETVFSSRKSVSRHRKRSD